MPSSPLHIPHDDGLRALGPEGWQSLIDYLSSRVRVASQVYVSRYHRFTRTQRGEFLEALSHEVVRVIPKHHIMKGSLTTVKHISTVMLAFANLLNPYKIISPPCLQRVFALLFQEAPVDPIAMDAATHGGHHERDAMLSAYEEEWWRPGNEPKRLSPVELMDVWAAQRSMIARPLPRSPPTDISLGLLSREALLDARNFTSKALEDVEQSLTANWDSMGRVETSLREYQGHLDHIRTAIPDSVEREKVLQLDLKDLKVTNLALRSFAALRFTEDEWSSLQKLSLNRVYSALICIRETFPDNETLSLCKMCLERDVFFAFNSIGLTHLILKNPPPTSPSLYRIHNILNNNSDPAVLLSDEMGGELRRWGLEVEHVPDWLRNKTFKLASMEQVYEAVHSQTDRISGLTKQHLILLKGVKEGLLDVLEKLEKGVTGDIGKVRSSAVRIADLSRDWRKVWKTREDVYPFPCEDI
ncbi:hypothetical protein BKA70DRAFT_1421831 [Coprinopsis sp. MPI-PUGE-AT-0042]|nr:hypothetical protein BKA70DRAFT_1421831 [Coprinopsis sp. MPI-PUGE-AT-0042]